VAAPSSGPEEAKIKQFYRIFADIENDRPWFLLSMLRVKGTIACKRCILASRYFSLSQSKGAFQMSQFVLSLLLLMKLLVCSVAQL